MNKFCETCTDRGSELCALPTAAEWLKRRGQLALAEVGNIASAVAEVSMSGTIQEPGAWVLEARQAVEDEAARVGACVRAHQGGDKITDSI